GLFFVEGADLAAVDGQAPAHRPYSVGRNDAVGLDPEVAVAVAVGHRLPGDLEHVLVALGGDEPEVLHLAFEELVGGHGGAVARRADRVTADAEQLEHLVHTGHEPLGRVRRCGRRLGGDQLAGVLVDGYNVGKGAAGV